MAPGTLHFPRGGGHRGPSPRTLMCVHVWMRLGLWHKDLAFHLLTETMIPEFKSPPLGLAAPGPAAARPRFDINRTFPRAGGQAPGSYPSL